MVNRQARTMGLTVAGFAAAALMSLAGAGSARADAWSDIVADVQAELVAGQAAIGVGAADLANGDTADGLTQLFIGLDDDLIGVPNDLQVGAIDALSGVAVIPAGDFEISFATPASFAASITEATNFYNEGNTLATEILSLPVTDYADTALDNALSTIDQWILPEQIQLIGELAYMF